MRRVLGRALLAFAVLSGTAAMGQAGDEKTGGAAMTGSWVLVTSKAAFSPRDSAKRCIFKGKMWLSNGYYHGNVNIRDLWNSAEGKAWTLVRKDTPYDMYAEMAAYQNKLWAAKKSVWHSSDGSNWTRVLEKTPFDGCGELRNITLARE